jgi:hypothetical protein
MNTNTARKETLKDLAENVGIIVKSGSSTPYENMDDWQKNAHSYRITLIYQGRKHTLDYWQGIGCKDEPTAESVLYCLLSDASCLNESFEDFCSNCGYDNDSMNAKRIYNKVVKQTEKLKNLLGEDFDRFFLAEQD